VIIDHVISVSSVRIMFLILKNKPIDKYTRMRKTDVRKLQ
jgi:hypothetical protein